MLFQRKEDEQHSALGYYVVGRSVAEHRVPFLQSRLLLRLLLVSWASTGRERARRRGYGLQCPQRIRKPSLVLRGGHVVVCSATVTAN